MSFKSVEDAESLLSKQERQSEDSYDELQPTVSFSRRHNLVHTICCVLAGAAISFLLVGATSKIFFKPVILEYGLEVLKPGDVPLENEYWCGHSAEEAKANGCLFDVILYSWVPPPCYDAELQVDYMSRKENAWYRHGGQTGGRDLIALQDVMAGKEETSWVSWAFHIYHCKFIFKMMTRILQNRTMGIPGTFLDYHHTEHCIDVLREDEFWPMESVMTIATMNYSTCYYKQSPGLDWMGQHPLMAIHT